MSPPDSTLSMQRQQKVAAGMNNPARIVLIRHGETDWNVDARFQGQIVREPQPCLTDTGLMQAQEVAKLCGREYTAASRIYCSDLKRARQVLYNS